MICEACGHTHQGPQLGGICIGCACPARAASVAFADRLAETLTRIRDDELRDVLAYLRAQRDRKHEQGYQQAAAGIDTTIALLEAKEHRR